jgi:hypothetical protein
MATLNCNIRRFRATTFLGEGPLEGAACARICVILLVQNRKKMEKIGKSVGSEYIEFIKGYGIWRMVANSEEVPEDPRVGSSILSPGSIRKKTVTLTVAAFPCGRVQLSSHRVFKEQALCARLAAYKNATGMI